MQSVELVFLLGYFYLLGEIGVYPSWSICCLSPPFSSYFYHSLWQSVGCVTTFRGCQSASVCKLHRFR